jgi:hypothetical protein
MRKGLYFLELVSKDLKNSYGLMLFKGLLSSTGFLSMEIISEFIKSFVWVCVYSSLGAQSYFCQSMSHCLYIDNYLTYLKLVG